MILDEIILCTVPCSMPNNPMNGMVTCDEGDDGILSYQDTCTTSCNTGFMVDGDATRTCQSNMMFDGTEATCSRSKQHILCMSTAVYRICP